MGHSDNMIRSGNTDWKHTAFGTGRPNVGKMHVPKDTNADIERIHHAL